MRAQQTLTGAAPAHPATEAENALLASAGTEKADPKIRAELLTEQRQRRADAARYSYADAILFWNSAPTDNGQPLDAAEEARRLNESHVMSAQSTDGGTPAAAPAEQPKPADTPVIEKDDKSGGWFSGWF